VWRNNRGAKRRAAYNPDLGDVQCSDESIIETGDSIRCRLIESNRIENKPFHTSTSNREKILKKIDIELKLKEKKTSTPTSNRMEATSTHL
jgi:hypothetical protein